MDLQNPSYRIALLRGGWGDSGGGTSNPLTLKFTGGREGKNLYFCRGWGKDLSKSLPWHGFPWMNQYHYLGWEFTWVGNLLLHDNLPGVYCCWNPTHWSECSIFIMLASAGTGTHRPSHAVWSSSCPSSWGLHRTTCISDLWQQQSKCSLFWQHYNQQEQEPPSSVLWLL